MHNQQINNALLKNLIIWFLLLPVLLCTIWSSLARAQDNPAEILKQAQAKYDQGYFSEVISMLSNQSFINKQRRVEVFALLARAHIAMDNPDMAETMVIKLLKLNKKYESATPMDPGFQILVRRIKEKQELEQTRSKLTYWIMGGTAFAIVSYFVLKPEKKKEELLPVPPSHPGK